MQHNLAYNMRPKTIEEVVGQQHLLGPGKIINRMINAKRLTSMILYGPPGTGKTSIAQAISGSTGFTFEYFNAVKDDKQKLSIFAQQAKLLQQSTIIFLDEIHRLNKDKQDFLLPYMEDGTFIVIGATTENPYINVTPAIRSRCQIFEVKSLKPEDILLALNRALTSKQGLLENNVKISEEDKLWLAGSTDGDLRSALNALELAVLSTPKENDKTVITREILEECTQKKTMAGDKNGDSHYDTISAFQKSIRGSDADAALHYLARILEAGDLNIAMRRLLVIAFEDIGLANPQAGQYTVSAVQSAKLTGLPEARIPLASATVYLALSPKSNTAYNGINSAIKDLKQSGIDLNIPNHLKDSHYKGASELGHGNTYQYPHDYQNDWVPQEYLPTSLQGKHYLEFSGEGNLEESLGKRYLNLSNLQQKYLNEHKEWNKK